MSRKKGLPRVTPELFDIALTPFNEVATYHFDLKNDDVLKRFDIVDDYAFGHPFLQRLTGDVKFSSAAMRPGEFALADVHDSTTSLVCFRPCYTYEARALTYRVVIFVFSLGVGGIPVGPTTKDNFLFGDIAIP
jgi:hypothetical protein